MTLSTAILLSVAAGLWVGLAVLFYLLLAGHGRRE
jgi:hypothetical protein